MNAAGSAWRGKARRGTAGHGSQGGAWRGKARLGMARRGRRGRQGMAWLGAARLGTAGKAHEMVCSMNESPASRITSKLFPILLGVLVAASMYPWGAQ